MFVDDKRQDLMVLGCTFLAFCPLSERAESESAVSNLIIFDTLFVDRVEKIVPPSKALARHYTQASVR